MGDMFEGEGYDWKFKLMCGGVYIFSNRKDLDKIADDVIPHVIW